MAHLLVRDVRLGAGEPRCDVLIRDGLIAQVGGGLAAAGAPIVDGRGHALLPGLHDHHIHLLATAAAQNSVLCGAPAVTNRAELGVALRAAEPKRGWVRGVDLDETRTGQLDRHVLDALRGDVAVRVQHLSGSLWVVNSAGVQALHLDQADAPGVERDDAGVPTGRLWRADALLRERLGEPDPPDLSGLARRLARFGITGVTDATPDLDPVAVAALTGPAIAQRVVLLGADGPAPRKIVVSDHALPPLDDLVALIAGTRPRAVALHCVTRVGLLLVLAALQEVGAILGDRIEHAAVTPPEAAHALARLGVTVITQPSLVARRGDRYLDEVDADDQPVLWPFASLDAAGVPVACSSDAPYGDPDPWVTIRAAVERRAPSGRSVAAHESVTAARALRGFLTDPLDPGGRPRSIVAGAVADLVLLDRALEDVLAEPTSDAVAMTIIGGRPID